MVLSCLTGYKVHPNPHKSGFRVKCEVLFVACLFVAGTGLYGCLYIQKISL